MQEIEAPPGYGQQGIAYPPILPKPPPEVVRYTDLSNNAKPVSEDIAREALIRYIDTTCCWGSGPAKEANIQTEAWSSIACIVESFVEHRVPMWNQVPHKGEYFTPLGGGYAPQPWEIIAPPVPHFNPQVENIDVPYTSTVFTCPECHGHRRVPCKNCGGDGKLRCNVCGGDGRITTHHDGKSEQKRCNHCGGDGRVKCHHLDCNGSGKITCPSCDGFGNVRKYAYIRRTHEILTNSIVVDRIPDNELSPDLITAAGGLEILKAQAVNIAPPQGFSPDLDNALVQLDITASNAIMAKNAYLHQEKLLIKSVPVSKATAKVDDKTFHYWVYGTENTCFIKEEWGYPAQCCCGCILS